MSFLWTLTAAFLYTEAAVITLLLLPIISSKTWNRIFKSRFVGMFTAYASLYFNGCLIILGLMLIEALRHVSAQNKVYQELKSNPSLYKPETESVYLMKLFRAQRNLYISGFSLFLWFVFRRLVTLIADHARVTVAGEASLAQAKSATEAAQRLMSGSPTSGSSSADTEGHLEVEITKLRGEINDLKEQLETEVAAHKRAKTQVEAITMQAKQATKEYDRVTAECQQLQKKLAAIGGDSEGKKKD
uniref:Endoplasmic reticulum transmembrane protein n=1 Tax=Mesocestoides corti TaxID=53468 RepID=A0A5K3EMM3_MESCO